MKQKSNYRLKLVFVGMVAAIVLGNIQFADGATITVGSGEGCDFDTIQAGIEAAMDGDTILVVSGEYIITEPVTFRGKAITVKSEAGPDQTTIRMGTPANPDRASVVIFENKETAASILEGFTITGGKGCWVAVINGSVGGGIYFNDSSGTVKNCLIVRNTATYTAGVNCDFSSSPTFIDCVITDNSAEENTGGVGTAVGASMILTNCIISGNSAKKYCGGASCANGAALNLKNCIIAENSAALTGGGLMSFNGTLVNSVTMTNCIVTDNVAQTGVGGGIHFAKCSATVTNCIITGNTAGSGGGGVGCVEADSSLTIRNCTIWGNSTTGSYYPGFDGGGVGCFRSCSVEVTNSIIWGNTSPRGDQIAVNGGNSALTIVYSNVSGGQAKAHVDSGCTLNWGEGNIDADPLFAEPGYWADINDPNILVEPDDTNAIWIDGDYHLKSEAGRWDPYIESWIMDDVTSPCIDRGDPHNPVGDEPNPNGSIINMGAYGGTPEASMSIGHLPPLPPLAHWKLDEIEGDIAYDSAGVNDALVLGGPLWRPDGGMVAGALQFDGVDDYVSTSFVLNPEDGSFSIFAWIKGGASGQVIVSQEGGASWLMADNSDGALRTDLRASATTGRNAKPAGPPLICPAVVTDNDWHQVGFARDGSDRILYVDDIEVARDTAETLESAEGGLYFGVGNSLAPCTFFSGLIDDIRIYNRVVSP